MTRDDILLQLTTDAQRFQAGPDEVAGAFNAFAEALAMLSLDTAEQWVAGQPRRHFADPELTEPAGTGADHGA